MEDILPPDGKRGLSIPPRNPQAKTAAARLAELGYDPMVELVLTHRSLNKIVDEQERMMDGSLVMVPKPGEKPKKHSPMIHMQALSQKAEIGTKLAEYAYKKAHQEEQSDRPTIPFTINVHPTTSRPE